MKQASLSMLFVMVIVMVIVPSMAMAQTLKPDCNPTLPPSQTENFPEYPAGSGKTPGPCNLEAFSDWVVKIIDFMMVIAIPIGVIFIALGGFYIMTAGGNQERFSTGKKIITGAVIGLAIALGSWLIINSLNFFLKTPLFK